MNIITLLIAGFKFPRVEVILDAIDLELSDSCKEFCKGQPVDAVGFYKKYGALCGFSFMTLLSFDRYHFLLLCHARSPPA
jgi:hypothetical protein